MFIRFGWGGCGNLIKNCLTSNINFEEVIQNYQQLTPEVSWTDQEWKLRNDKHYKLSHDYNENGIKLVWSNPIDTSFHYILKNITINHLPGDITDRVKGVIWFNQQLEQKLKQHQHTVLDKILIDSESLHNFCVTVDPTIRLDKVEKIYKMWKSKTQEYYFAHSKNTLTHLTNLGLDYTPITLYNILYANSYIR